MCPSFPVWIQPIEKVTAVSCGAARATRSMTLAEAVVEATAGQLSHMEAVKLELGDDAWGVGKPVGATPSPICDAGATQRSLCAEPWHSHGWLLLADYYRS